MILLSVLLVAQFLAPVSYTLRIYPTGSQSAITTTIISPAEVTCGTTSPPHVTANPRGWAWVDPVSPTEVCLYFNSLLFDSLPDGSYEGVRQTTYENGTTSLSSRTPFVRRRPICTVGDTFKVTVRKQNIAAQDAKMVGWTRISTVQLKGNNFELTYRCVAS